MFVCSILKTNATFQSQSAVSLQFHFLRMQVTGVQNMDGKRGSMCTDTDRFSGNKVGCQAPLACEAMIGPMLHSGYGYCTDLNVGKFGMTGAMRAAMMAQRRTTAGVPCRLPLVYK